MPETTIARVAWRAVVVMATLGLLSGVFVAPPDTDARAAVPAATPATTTSTTFALPVPSTTTTTLPAPVAVAPPATTPPTTAAPRQVAAPAPKPAAPVYVAQSSQERGAAALAMIDFPWQRLGYRISFEPGVKTYLGLTNSETREIRIFVRDNESMDTLARTIAHELGHALDFGFITDDEAARYIAIRGIDATPATWFGCNACTDYQTAAGDFAETFQYWLLGDGQYFSQMGPKPSVEQLAQLAAIFVVDTPAGLDTRS